jgi:hypothetical protein
MLLSGAPYKASSVAEISSAEFKSHGPLSNSTGARRVRPEPTILPSHCFDIIDISILEHWTTEK